MIVVLSPEDLAYDFKGSRNKPKLTDFPVLTNSALDVDAFGPDDVVIYRYQDEDEETTVVLRGPCVESTKKENLIQGLITGALKL
jgi:hypothetical protein